MNDGTWLEENQPHPRGGLEDPLPPREIEDKFRANALLALPARNVDEIIQLVGRLEQIPSMRPIDRKVNSAIIIMGFLIKRQEEL